jgi:hypothetical protein
MRRLRQGHIAREQGGGDGARGAYTYLGIRIATRPSPELSSKT